MFKLPRVSAGSRSVELRASELAMILDGIDMSKLKRVPRYERGAGTISDNKADDLRCESSAPELVHI